MANDYTGIRSRFPNLRYNAFVVFGADVESIVSKTKENFRDLFKDDAEYAALKPWKVETIPASWGYPDRVMVTW